MLLILGLRRGVHATEYLVHWLPRRKVAFREPPFAVVRASAMMPSPVDIGDGILDDCVLRFRNRLTIGGCSGSYVPATPGGIIWPGTAQRKAPYPRLRSYNQE